MDFVIPKVIGHRGAAGHAPENTLASIRKASELGAKWVEFDIKLSRDDVLVLMHDDTLGRTTNAKGAVADQELDALQKLDAGSWFDSTFAGERIPSLEETLTLAARLGLGCNIEVKPSPFQDESTALALAKLLGETRHLLAVPILVSSFSKASLVTLHRVLPNVPRGLIVREIPNDWEADLRRLDCVSLHCGEGGLNQAKASAIREAGYELLAFTVNDAKRAATLFGWGVTAVFSDYPERV
ncbi:MAG: glycerophosphoryl diester phosphodiesterase [Proteobacteria bacterium]|nr:glycerophosphoryl diester phosphodiesterase [Pseudomonadota bacterium]